MCSYWFTVELAVSDRIDNIRPENKNLLVECKNTSSITSKENSKLQVHVRVVYSGTGLLS